MKRSIGLVFAFFGICAALAWRQAAADVVPGVWNSDFVASTNYAAKNDMPLVLVWGDTVTCGYCRNMHSALQTQTGIAWASDQDAIFCIVNSSYSFTDPIIAFAGGPTADDATTITKFPYIRFYWPTRASKRMSGQSFPSASEDPLDAAGLAALLADFTAAYDDFIGGIQPSASHAAFPMGDNPCDRLEAIAGETDYVDIPLVRTNATQLAASCKLRFTYGGQSTQTTVSWAADESFKLVRYALPLGLAANAQVTVTLVDPSGEELATRRIWCLAEVENSPKNPYWIGEKTSDTLDWGEWSMDLDVVTNKVNAWNAAHPADRAYAMMFVGGSTWCPDCAMAEANFFSKQAFKDWASAHKVVFGVLDIPNNPQATEATPSQLRYESYRTSDAYVTLRGTAATNETERYQSGAGYLSRHAVDYGQARDVAARNAFLMGHDTLHGGWNRPERGNKNRTGVPVLLLLRGDGTVAARWNRFSDVGPSAYSDGYLKRFEEVFALVDAPNEETDCDRTTTTRSVESGDMVLDSVSSVDQADVFRIADAAENRVVSYRVTGDVTAPLKASIVDGATGTVLEKATGDAAKGFTLSAKLGASGYFLRIEPETIADGTFFGYTNMASTVCRYQIAATGFPSGGEIGFAMAVTNVSETCGTVQIPVCRRAGAAGAASVKVKLSAKSGEGVDGRIDWTDKTLDWADGDSRTQYAVLTVYDDAVVRGDMQLSFELTDLVGGAADLALSQDMLFVNVYDDEVFGIAAYRFVAFDDARAIEGYQVGDEVVLTAKSGALPEGVAVESVGGMLRIVGVVADAGGTYEAVYEVAIRRGGLIVSQEDVPFALTVVDYDFAGDIPSLATTRTYDNLPRLAESGDDTLVVGLLTVTVPKNGQLSAKYCSAGRTFAYSSAGWASFDDENGALTAQLLGTDDPTRTMSVTLDAKGGMLSFEDPVDGVGLSFDLPAAIWPDGAAAYRGQYTVQMPQTNVVDGLSDDARTGAAYMALRMVDASAVQSGRMLYAGVLPNGRAFYGSRTLVDAQSVGAVLPFYHYSDMKTSGYVFSGGLALAKNAETTFDLHRWSVTSFWLPVWATNDAIGHESDFAVFGGYYDPDRVTENFATDFSGKLDDFAFQVASAAIVGGRHGAGAAFAPVLAEMTSTNMPQLVEGTANPQDVVLRYSLETGVVYGSLRLPFANGDSVAVTFRGVALPGWQGCDTCAAKGFVTRPWAVGSCSFSDLTNAGFLRNGCLIKLDQYK